MIDYIQQGKGKVVQIKFPNLGHILDLEPLAARLTITFRVAIVTIDDSLQFAWNHRVLVSDETVNIELNNIVSKNPGVQISFSNR